jgi:AcrR family transcriptional regulator
VRLVQYYFGSKDALLLATQRHVAERATARLTALINSTDAPRVRLGKILRSFIPTDDESRENMLMFVVLHTASLVDPTLARREASDVPDALHRTVKMLLVEAGCRRRPMRRTKPRSWSARSESCASRSRRKHASEARLRDHRLRDRQGLGLRPADYLRWQSTSTNMF